MLRALGVIIIFFAWLGCSAPELSEVQVQKARQIAANVDPDQLHIYLDQIVVARSQEEPANYPWSIRAHYRLKTQEVLRGTWQSLGFDVREDITESDGLPIANLYVDIPGISGSSDLIVVGAHYDSFWPGADDNATGVAVLLEMARVLGSAPRPKRTIRLVAFDQEENGALGSVAYVAQHRNDRVLVAFNIDSVGFYRSTSNSQQGVLGFSFPSTADFLFLVANEPAEEFSVQFAQLSNRMVNPVHVEGALLPKGGAYSGMYLFQSVDHASFWNAGIPMLSLWDTNDLRNDTYHLESDTEDTLDFETFHRVTQLVLGAAFAFADKD